MASHTQRRLLAWSAAISAAGPGQQIDSGIRARIEHVLARTPPVDGHKNRAEQLRGCLAGGQFWSVYIPPKVTGDTVIRETSGQNLAKLPGANLLRVIRGAERQSELTGDEPAALDSPGPE